MEIQKYKANDIETGEELIGYITETREYLGNGAYGNGTSYVISVTEKSMPGGNYGTHTVDVDSIKELPNKKDETKIAEFIRWAENCGEDAFYIFDNPQEAISNFFNNA